MPPDTTRLEADVLVAVAVGVGGTGVGVGGTGVGVGGTGVAVGGTGVGDGVGGGVGTLTWLHASNSITPMATRYVRTGFS